MKIKYVTLFSIAGMLLASGCKKDYLNTEPTEFVTPEQLGEAAKQDPALLDGSIAGLYTTMFTDGVGGTTRHDDFGQKGVDIYSDMLCSDMVLGALNYGWYSPVVRYQATVDFTRNEDYIPWRYYYRQVFGANAIIDILGGTDAVPESAESKVTMGQAKTMRAYGYFYLSQLYAPSYGDGSAKILPLYKGIGVDNTNLPKSTAAEVWDLMVSDLTTAIEYLDGFSRTTKDQVDQNVARGLLAYVLAARGTAADWTKVASLCEEIKAAYPKTTPIELVYNGNNTDVAGFNNVATPSWMWGVDLTLAQNIDLISWWGQVDLFTYSYAWAGDPKVIDEGLYNAIHADDIRKGQFDPPNGGVEGDYGYGPGDFDYMPINKFFDPGRVDGGQRQVITDLLYMRADEFYLLYAEAQAYLNNDDGAKQALKEYLTDRITDLSYVDALTGQALKDEIYLQTRIELWGEGKSYLAMKRDKATITRGANHLFFDGESFPYTAPELTFVIPQAEVLNNPNLNN
ncbi:MAG: RagB/SusD family nutrient uptake outer membrane protein [Chitinophagaceae bacterium]|nr:RagB/SusD family nutrient uptake outer membrane protein [Chitinophagaceae bacterium]